MIGNDSRGLLTYRVPAVSAIVCLAAYPFLLLPPDAGQEKMPTWNKLSPQSVKLAITYLSIAWRLYIGLF